MKLNLKDASPEDVTARLKELREEFITLDEGRRSEIGDEGLRAMVEEVDILDHFLTISATVQRREKETIAATAGALLSAGNRSLGEAYAVEDLFTALERNRGASVEFTRNGISGTRSLAFEQEFDGEEGKRLSQWLRGAGIYGADGMRAITEWASGGPPTFDTTDSGGLLPRLGQPIPPVPRQAKLYLRDLIPTMPTTLPIMPYVRELNPVLGETTGGATAVAEGVTKPTAALSFVSENAPITTVATTLAMSKQMFADAPAVIAYVNSRLPYLVKLSEDNEILNGSGTWPNLTGILNTPGILSVNAVSGETAITIGNGFAAVENQDGQVDAVVMNPTDAWAMFTKRAAGGSGTFDAGTPFSALPLTVWGVPTYRSRVYASGHALVADFGHGAMIADREAVNMQTYNERYAEQNLALLICEERFGLMVFRPDLFAECTIA